MILLLSTGKFALKMDQKGNFCKNSRISLEMLRRSLGWSVLVGRSFVNETISNTTNTSKLTQVLIKGGDAVEKSPHSTSNLPPSKKQKSSDDKQITSSTSTSTKTTSSSLSEEQASSIDSFPFTSPFKISTIDSHRNILDLGTVLLTRQQSEAILEVMHDIVIRKLLEANHQLLTQHGYTRDLGIFEAAQKTLEMELKREMGMRGIEAKAHRESLLTKVQDLNDRIREALGTLRNDCQSVINEYKNRNREAEQEIDVELHKITGQLTVAEGNFKAKLESVKLKAITLFSYCLLSIFMLVIGERALSGGGHSSGKR